VLFAEYIEHHWDEASDYRVSPHFCSVIESERGKSNAIQEFYDIAYYEQQLAKPPPSALIVSN